MPGEGPALRVRKCPRWGTFRFPGARLSGFEVPADDRCLEDQSLWIPGSAALMAALVAGREPWPWEAGCRVPTSAEEGLGVSQKMLPESI